MEEKSPDQPSLASLQEVLRESLPAKALPSWVVFPDKARAEWVNSLLSQVTVWSLAPCSLPCQVWPQVARYCSQVLCDTIQPLVDSALK